MRWRDARESDNVEDERGAGIRMGMPLGLGGIAVIVVAGLLMGQSPLQILSFILQTQGTTMETRDDSGPAPDSRADDARVHFVRAILGETEDVWAATFQRAGRRYEPPRLVLFTRAVQSACGGATAASGPFYCPNDRRVYLDLSFFDEMQTHLGGGGDFAEAYVIAHEVGHHVQNLLGIFDRVQQERARGGRMAGDVEEALGTASAIGDDRLQQQTRGTVVPDAFTHGTSQQRVRWFKAGFEQGHIAACDTFAPKSP